MPDNGSDLYSIRQRKASGKFDSDVYQYETLPDRFRVQVIYIWMSSIGTWADKEEFIYYNDEEGRVDNYSNEYWHSIYRKLTRDLGLLDLPGGDAFAKIQQFFRVADTSDCLDLIDLSFRTINSQIRALWEEVSERPDLDENRSDPLGFLDITQAPDEAIYELNQRFQEHGIGYAFAGQELVRVDSLYLHREVVKPAITLLHDEEFHGASDEFHRAHEHYRGGRNKEAIVEAAKAFESTLKTICDRREWPYPAGAGAQRLIDVVLSNGLIENSLQAHISAVRATLESGLPTIRNKTSAHGQGMQQIEVPDHLVAYALHIAGAAIVMLVDAYKLQKSSKTV